MRKRDSTVDALVEQNKALVAAIVELNRRMSKSLDRLVDVVSMPEADQIQRVMAEHEPASVPVRRVPDPVDMPGDPEVEASWGSGPI